jgi:hypothetical protein
MKQAEHCRPVLALSQRPNRVQLAIINEAIAARLRNAHVEPNRRIERRLLMQQQMCEFQPEIGGRFGSIEIAVLLSPLGNRIHDTRDELAHRAFPFRRSQPAMKILAGHDIGRGLPPGRGHQHILLFKNHAAVRIGNACGTQFPSQLVFCITGLARQMAGKPDPGFVSNPLAGVRHFDRSCCHK